MLEGKGSLDIDMGSTQDSCFPLPRSMKDEETNMTVNDHSCRRSPRWAGLGRRHFDEQKISDSVADYGYRQKCE